MTAGCESAAGYDVIVAGYGGAGAAAAIAAHDAGARVLVLEKAPVGGGSTAESGGSFATVLDRDGAIEHYLAITEGRTPREVPGLDAAWMCIMRSFGFVMVDASASRFLAEPTVEHHAAGHALLVRDFRTGEFTRLPSYLIFDDVTRRAGPIVTNEAGANRVLTWSESNLDEVGKGWIKRSDSVAGLARELSLPPNRLEDTVREYNRAAVDGGDEFGRSPAEMVPLREPPLYGIPVWPALFNTQGGPRRGAGGEVIGTDGMAVPGLFSAGELGSIWGSLYPGAGNVTEAVVFGRLAGRRAAA